MSRGSSRYSFSASKTVWNVTRAGGTHCLPISDHAVLPYEKNIFVFCGIDKTGKATNQCSVLNTGGLKSWTKDIRQTGVAPKPRAGLSCALMKYNNTDHVAVFGGVDGSHYFNDLLMFNPKTSRWARPRTEGKLPLALAYHSATAISDSKMVVFGGKFLTVARDEMYLFHVDRRKNCWSRITYTGDAPSKRYSHCAMNWKDKLVLFGGTDGKSLYSDLYFLNTDTFEWSKPEVKGSVPPVANASAAMIGDVLYVVGGVCADGPSYSYFYFIDLNELQWKTCEPDYLGVGPGLLVGHRLALMGSSNLYNIGGANNTGLHVISTTKIIPVDVSETGSESAPVLRKSATQKIAEEDKADKKLKEEAELKKKKAEEKRKADEKRKVEEKRKAEEQRERERKSKAAADAEAKKKREEAAAALTKKELEDKQKQEQAEAKAQATQAAEAETKQEPAKQEKPKSAAKPCQKCGAVPEAGSKFCDECGYDMSKPLPKSDAESVPAKEAPVKETPEDDKKTLAALGAASQLENFAKSMEEKTQQLNDAKKDLARLEQESTRKDEEIKTLTARIEKLSASLEKLKAKQESSSQNAAALADVKANELKQVEEKLATQKEKLVQEVERRKQAELEKEEAEKNLRGKIREAEGLQEQLTAVNARVEEEKKLKETAEQKLQKKLQEIEVLSMRTKDLEESTQQLTGEENKKEEETSELINTLRGEVAELRVSVEVKSKSLDERETEVASLKEKLQNQKKLVDELAAKEEEDAKSRAAFEQQSSESTDDLTGQIAELEEKLATALATSSTLESQIAELDGENANLNGELAKLEKGAKETEDMISTLEHSKEQLNAEFAEACTKISALEERLAGVNENANEELEALKAESAKLQEELTEVTTERDELIEENEKVSIDLRSSLDAVKKLTKDVEKLTSDNTKLNSDIAAGIKRNEELAQRLTEAKSTNQDPSEWQAKIDTYQASLDEKSEMIEKLENEVEQWMVASEQLQGLGEEAVREVTEEANSLRDENETLMLKYEEEVKRRREVEAELASSEAKLNELDAVLGRLMNLGK
eukprot:TRINITY_DN5066_c0_g1_i2.p1 TRINITY_DN5066_c0_g1~~TRINITY_DN5066_c0_g1_i2.p1  ORF type:complete len:1057 (+),score=345.54 TRINITY_DN5066_c0_g1_i2:42-3212(+)